MCPLLGLSIPEHLFCYLMMFSQLSMLTPLIISTHNVLRVR